MLQRACMQAGMAEKWLRLLMPEGMTASFHENRIHGGKRCSRCWWREKGKLGPEALSGA
jgi:hypothetical protein